MPNACPRTSSRAAPDSDPSVGTGSPSGGVLGMSPSLHRPSRSGPPRSRRARADRWAAESDRMVGPMRRALWLLTILVIVLLAVGVYVAVRRDRLPLEIPVAKGCRAETDAGTLHL